MAMATYGGGAWQSRMANRQQDDQNSFDRTMQLAALASMMNEKAAIGFGLGNLLASYFAKQRAAKADALAAKQAQDAADAKANAPILDVLGHGDATISDNPITGGLPVPQRPTLGSSGYTLGNSISVGNVPAYLDKTWQDTPTPAEVTQAAATLGIQTPQGSTNVTASTPQTLTLVNPQSYSQSQAYNQPYQPYQFPTVNTDWLNKKNY